MVTVVFGKSEDDFWRMTPKKTQSLIREHIKYEGERMKQTAGLTGYATACYQNGIVPFDDERKNIIDNDNACLM